MTAIRQSLLLTQWQFRRQAQSLPLLIIVQIFMAVATVIGYGLLVGDPTPETARYLATGAPTVTLITAASVGYAMATLLPPAVATLMTQMLIFIVLLCSPVSYPADRLPSNG